MLLKNEYLHVEIAASGAELMRIYDVKNDRELLWNGDAKYWKRRSPILFPNVGKTYGNEFRFGGKAYPTCQHGFARDMDFILESSDEISACWLLESTAETLARYPFDFELRIRYVLEGKRLKVIWIVSNTGAEEMPFTIGGHPAFCFEGSKENWQLHFPGKESFTHFLLDPACGCVVKEQEHNVSLEKGYLRLNDEMFAHDALILDGNQVDEVWLCDKAGTPRLGMKCEGFPNYGIWSVPGAPFVCLEPWMGRCDDAGYAGEFRDKANINLLASGERFKKEYTILLP